MYKAFDLKGFDRDFAKFEIRRNSLIDRGRAVTSGGKEDIREALMTIAAGKAVLDGQAIQDSWFPLVKADVFLSHSHRNEEDILMLAGWLDDRFGLKPFVDSAIWGYAADLLKLIDQKYSWLDEEKTIYNYYLRNESTSHVHMMLMTALGMMIHKAECLIFVNTPNSIAAQQVVTAQTRSPWIFAELTMAGIVEITTPDRLDREEKRIVAKGMLKEAEERERLAIMHTVRDMKRLRPIGQDVLMTWAAEREQKGVLALDKLYEVAAR